MFMTYWQCLLAMRIVNVINLYEHATYVDHIQNIDNMCVIVIMTNMYKHTPYVDHIENIDNMCVPQYGVQWCAVLTGVSAPHHRCFSTFTTPQPIPSRNAGVTGVVGPRANGIEAVSDGMVLKNTLWGVCRRLVVRSATAPGLGGMRFACACRRTEQLCSGGSCSAGRSAARLPGCTPGVG